jgi:hypothetical protein
MSDTKRPYFKSIGLDLGKTILIGLVSSLLTMAGNYFIKLYSFAEDNLVLTSIGFAVTTLIVFGTIILILVSIHNEGEKQILILTEKKERGTLENLLSGIKKNKIKSTVLFSLTAVLILFQYFVTSNFKNYLAVRKQIYSNSEIVSFRYEPNKNDSLNYKIIFEELVPNGSISSQINISKRISSDLKQEIIKYNLPISIYEEKFSEEEISQMAEESKKVYYIHGFFDDYGINLTIEDRSIQNNFVNYLEKMLGDEKDDLQDTVDSLLVKANSDNFGNIHSTLEKGFLQNYELQAGASKDLKYLVMKMIGELMLNEVNISLAYVSDDPYVRKQLLLQDINYAASTLELAEQNIMYDVKLFPPVAKPRKGIDLNNLYLSLSQINDIKATILSKYFHSEMQQKKVVQRDSIHAAIASIDKALKYSSLLQDKFPRSGTTESNYELNSFFYVLNAYKQNMVKVSLLLAEIINEGNILTQRMRFYGPNKGESDARNKFDSLTQNTKPVKPAYDEVVQWENTLIEQKNKINEVKATYQTYNSKILSELGKLYGKYDNLIVLILQARVNEYLKTQNEIDEKANLSIQMAEKNIELLGTLKEKLKAN